MRVAIIGATSVAVMTARHLIDKGHDVILIERDRDRIDEISDKLDCGFIHGDGSSPDILREVGPEGTDHLICLSNSDQDNIIASLVGRSLGFRNVIPKIENDAYEQVCAEVGLQHTILPDRTISRNLTDMVEGESMMELSTMIRGDVRFFAYVVGVDDAVKVREVSYPKRTRPICVYRDGDFLVPEDDTKLRKGDEVVLITERDHIAELRKRWNNRAEDNNN
jgi:trk system potassium uptake protein